MSLKLSIIIPAYNVSKWLEPTTSRILDAVRAADITQFEIIIVDDGSLDETYQVAKKIASEHSRVSVLTHSNSGRYLTRKSGVLAAKYERILFVDSRVWIDQDSLAFLKEQLRKHPERLIWNGHINVEKKGNIIARFGDSLTFLGWRRYFKHPKLISYGLRDFDHYPKGTGLFSIPKSLINEAFEWFEKNTLDIKNSSDDTLLIRYLAGSNRIWLSPGFSATYFARTSLVAFIKHTYSRGRFFVDGFMRKGTRFYYPLLFVLAFSFSIPILIILYPTIIPVILLIFLCGWLLLVPVSLVLGLSAKDSFSLFLLLPLFSLMYVMGIWNAVIRKGAQR